ncbi:leucine-rich repeat protein [Tanacetum coccineum]
MILTFSSSSCLWFLVISSFCILCLCNQNQDDVLCKATERSALIQFKNKLIDQANRLSSWTGNDCCSWSGVVCDNFTGHVLEIRLRGPDDGTKGHCHGSYDTDDELEEASKQMLGGNISSSLLKLVQLRYLDLSCNDFKLIPIPAFIGSLENLTYLNMSKSQFGGEVPQKLGNLYRLRVLALQDDKFFSNLHSNNLRWLSNVKQLQHLDMAGVNLAEASDWLQVISTLSSLHELYLSSCGLTQIPGNPTTVSFTSLIVLDLSNNIFNSLLPSWIFSLHDLELLDLSKCLFGALNPIVTDVGFHMMPSLRTLRVSENSVVNSSSILDGLSSLTKITPRKLGRLKNLSSIDLCLQSIQEETIPDSIGSCHSEDVSDEYKWTELGKLSFLTLHHNFITGIVTENHFTNLTSLGTLWIGDNKLAFKLNENWIPPFQLSVLRIGSCSLGPRFPSWVQSQTMLTELDLANANISGIIPNWIWNTFSSLTFLNISHNNIQGRLGDISSLTVVARLDLSANLFTGLLPSNFSKPNLDFLDLSYNNISGSLDQYLCSEIQEPRLLRVLNLGNNNMSGVIPDCWINWESLIILNLEKNRFSGIIPPSLGNISSLASLDMRNNRLFGSLPVSLLNSKNLIILELAENELTGKIPASIGRESTSLKLLSLRSNKLAGNIPVEICHLSSVQILDLAHNDLSGNLPTCFKNFSVIAGRETSITPIVPYNILFQNQVFGSALLVTKGRLSAYSTILYLVTIIDLSKNLFSGSIPNELVELPGLRYLNVSQNRLTGRIPSNFSEMGQLESLDLSLNRLDGKIPSSLSSLSGLNFLNVSYNNLTGRIPTGPQLQLFTESSFVGNALCGAPLAACQPNNDDTEGINDQHDESNDIDWILVIFTLVGWIVGFWIIIVPLLVSMRWRIAYYHFLDKMRIKLQYFILLICPCFKRRKPLPGTISFTNQVQEFELSQYILNTGYKHNESFSEASSSTQQVQSSYLASAPLLEHWDRCNDVVLNWILSSLSQDVYLGYVFSDNAQTVWNELEETYDRIDDSIVFNSLQKINSFKQGGLPIFEYYHKLNSLWGEFDILTKLPDCPIRSSLLTKEVLPEVKDAFVILAREESHRWISATTTKSDKPQASVFFSRVNDVKRSNSDANWNNGNTSNNNKGNYNNLLCKNCGLKGHTIERCFENIGYPPSFKRNPNLKVNGTFNNNKSNNADLKGKSVETNDLKTTAGTLSFTHEQVMKLINLLNDKSGSTAHANMACSSVCSFFNCI